MLVREINFIPLKLPFDVIKVIIYKSLTLSTPPYREKKPLEPFREYRRPESEERDEQCINLKHPFEKTRDRRRGGKRREEGEKHRFRKHRQARDLVEVDPFSPRVNP